MSKHERNRTEKAASAYARRKKQGMALEKCFVNDAGGQEEATYSSESVGVWRSRPTEAD